MEFGESHSSGQQLKKGKSKHHYKRKHGSMLKHGSKQKNGSKGKLGSKPNYHCKPKTRKDLEVRCRDNFKKLFRLLSRDERTSSVIEADFTNKLKVFTNSDFYSKIVNDGTHLALFWEVFITEMKNEMSNGTLNFELFPCLAGWLSYSIRKFFTKPSQLPTAEVLKKVLLPNAKKRDYLYVFFATAVFSYICENEELKKFFMEQFETALIDCLRTLGDQGFDDEYYSTAVVFFEYAALRYESFRLNSNFDFNHVAKNTALGTLDLINELSDAISKYTRTNIENTGNLFERINGPIDIHLYNGTTLFGTEPKWTMFVAKIPCEVELSRRRIYHLTLQVFTKGSFKIGLYKKGQVYTKKVSYDPFEGYITHQFIKRMIPTTSVNYTEKSRIRVRINTQTTDCDKVLQFNIDNTEITHEKIPNCGSLNEWLGPLDKKGKKTSIMYLGIELPLFQAVKITEHNFH